MIIPYLLVVIFNRKSSVNETCMFWFQIQILQRKIDNFFLKIILVFKNEVQQTRNRLLFYEFIIFALNFHVLFYIMVFEQDALKDLLFSSYIHSCNDESKINYENLKSIWTVIYHSWQNWRLKWTQFAFRLK